MITSIFVQVLHTLLITGDNKNSNLGVPEIYSKDFVETGNDGQTYKIAQNEMATIFYQTEKYQYKTYSMGTNTKGMLCQPYPGKVYTTPTQIPDLTKTIMSISMTQTSALVLDIDRLYGCGSNENGELSYFGRTDTDNHILTPVVTAFIKDPERIRFVGSTSKANYVVTNKRVFVLGPCQFENMCEKDAHGMTYLTMPANFTEDVLEDVIFYPETIVLVRQTDGVNFVLGVDHCSKKGVHKDWHIVEFSQTEQLFFGKKVTIFSQNDSVFACGFQGSPDGVMVPIQHQIGTVQQVACNGDAIIIAGTNGLYVSGENTNNVLGKCEESAPGICKPQILAQVVHEKGNQISVVEGLSTTLLYIAYPHQYYRTYYKPEAYVNSVYQAGDAWGFQSRKGFQYIENAAAFKQIKGNSKGFLARSQKDVLWAFSDELYYSFGFQMPVKSKYPIPVPFFQDHYVDSFDSSNSNGIVLTSRGWLYTFGNNKNGNMGKTLFEFDPTLEESWPKRVQMDFLQMSENIQQVGVVKNVYFIRTNMRILYWGLCEGQCGVDAAGKIIFDKEDVDRSEVRVMNLKFKVDHFDTFTDQIVLISTDKKVFGYGLNDYCQICQSINSNENGSTAENDIKLSEIHYFQVGKDKSLMYANSKLYFCGKNALANGNPVVDSQKYFIDIPFLIDFQHGQIKDIAVQGDLFLVLTNKGLFAKGYVSNPKEYGLNTKEIKEWTLLPAVDVSLVNHIHSIAFSSDNSQTYILQDDLYLPINIIDVPEEEEEEQPAEEEEEQPAEEEEEQPAEEEEEQPGEEEEEQDNKIGMPGWEIAVITIASIAGVGIIAAIIAIYMKKKNAVNNYKNIAEVHDEFERQI
ncbi:LPXTG-motif_cell wall anchor domain [Hexamita inflata]|uniref:LPXTG-motif cell wall anchor domain n=1 Tax=Hexamita inflata TaxID=28002 RepID=A0AA86QC19_9EUKA|nr:LPXTG-motif cell wall anchor domain [Hexamita inflata]